MGVTIIGGGGGSSGSGLDILPDSSFVRWKPNFPKDPPDLNANYYYSPAGLDSNEIRSNYCPTGLTYQYCYISATVHTSSATLTASNSILPANQTITLASMATKAGAADVYAWIGSMWLTNGNFLMCGINAAYTDLYVEEYDPSTGTWATSGTSIHVSGLAGNAPSTNEQSNGFGLMANGNYFVKMNNVSVIFQSDGTLIHEIFTTGAIPVNNYDSFHSGNDQLYFRRQNHPTKTNFTYTTGVNQQGYLPVNSLWLAGDRTSSNILTSGFATYDGYRCINDSCQVHLGDLSTWVEAVLDKAAGEGL